MDALNEAAGAADKLVETRDGDAEFWHGLIPEREAANFIGWTTRGLQARRQRGGGPLFVRLSSRSIRYRRIDLKAWADARVRRSTSDPGPS